MKLSQHARIRMQQRGIPRRVVDWLAAYGEVDHQRGSELFYFNRKSRRDLERDLGQHVVRRFSKALDAYMICADGQIATVGHRYQRVVRH
ncbi:MAG: hypothetical protein PVJ33_05185 [Lysobacterales bacterium]|jgi:hypothetical protein